MGGHYYEKQKQKHKTAISVHVILQLNIVDFLEVYGFMTMVIIYK